MTGGSTLRCPRWRCTPERRSGSSHSRTCRRGCLLCSTATTLATRRRPSARAAESFDTPRSATNERTSPPPRRSSLSGDPTARVVLPARPASPGQRCGGLPAPRGRGRRTNAAQRPSAPDAGWAATTPVAVVSPSRTAHRHACARYSRDNSLPAASVIAGPAELSRYSALARARLGTLRAVPSEVGGPGAPMDIGSRG